MLETGSLIDGKYRVLRVVGRGGMSVVYQAVNEKENKIWAIKEVRKENIGVTIHLVNGFQIKGNVKGFDNFTVVLDVMGKQQMVYKHAISTITPAKAVNFMSEKEEG